jgi:hypothetical protein
MTDAVQEVIPAVIRTEATLDVTWSRLPPLNKEEDLTAPRMFIR